MNSNGKEGGCTSNKAKDCALKGWLPSRGIFILPILMLRNEETASSNVWQTEGLKAEFKQAAHAKNSKKLQQKKYARLQAENQEAKQELKDLIAQRRADGFDPLAFDAAKAAGLTQKNINGILKRVAAGEKVEGLMPDQIFPNCVLTFRSAELIGRERELGLEKIDPNKTYFFRTPMRDCSRQREADSFVQFLKKEGGYIELPHPFNEPVKALEAKGIALEGTGACVLDRVNKVIYVALSSRSDERAENEGRVHLADQLAQKIGYETFKFRTVPHGPRKDSPKKDRKPIYHTDLMLNFLDGRHVLAYMRGVTPKKREEMRENLSRMPDGSRRTIYELTEDQFRSMCGNVQLMVNPKTHEKVLMMSSRAFKAFGGNLKTGKPGKFLKELSKSMNAKIRHAPIWKIEELGGGSACCLEQEGEHVYAHIPSLKPESKRGAALRSDIPQYAVLAYA